MAGIFVGVVAGSGDIGVCRPVFGRLRARELRVWPCGTFGIWHGATEYQVAEPRGVRRGLCVRGSGLHGARMSGNRIGG